jgi:hypothetical protein
VNWVGCVGAKAGHSAMAYAFAPVGDAKVDTGDDQYPERVGPEMLCATLAMWPSPIRTMTPPQAHGATNAS